MEDEHKKERTRDELPQSAAGKTIMTTEPKFVPKDAAVIRLNQDVEVLPDSERLWMNYLERYCENPEMERELCAEAVKKAIQAVPELAESEAFKQLQGKYKIVIDGENIRVGE